MGRRPKSQSFSISQLMFAVAAFAVACWVQVQAGPSHAFWSLPAMMLVVSLARITLTRTYAFGATVRIAAIVQSLMVVTAYGLITIVPEQVEQYALAASYESLPFLIVLILLSNTATPDWHPRRWTRRVLGHAFKVGIIGLVLAALVCISVDAASIPTLTDAGLESVRQNIKDRSPPELEIPAGSLPRTQAQTINFARTTVITLTFALIGVAVTIASCARDRAHRRGFMLQVIGFVLTIPAAVWMLDICYGDAHLLSTPLFDSIAAISILTAMPWILACVVAAMRLSFQPEAANEPTEAREEERPPSERKSDGVLHDSALWEAMLVIGGAYALYESRIVQDLWSSEVGFSEFAGSLSVVYLPVSGTVLLFVAARNLIARALRVPMLITESVLPIQRGGFAILVLQLLLVSPLCVLAGSIYWLVVVLGTI